MWKALVIDDESLARERVCRLLSKDKEIELVGECVSGMEALQIIDEKRPDLLFLDVQMPEMDGFELLSRLPTEAMPITIFITSYDRYAVQAFEVCAVDYLLKPYDEERFYKALERAKLQLLKTSSLEQASVHALRLSEDVKYLKRFTVKHRGRMLFIPIEEIYWFEAEGNYVRLHTAQASYILRETLINLEQSLHPEEFVRIHRSRLVHLKQVRELKSSFMSNSLMMINGVELQLSRRYYSRFKEMLKKYTARHS